MTSDQNILSIAVAIVINNISDQKSVLVVKRTKHDDDCPSWVFPGGKVEPGETTKSAAMRELYEETGIVANFYKTIGERLVKNGKLKISYLSFTSPDTSKQSIEDGKIAEITWIEIKEINAFFNNDLFDEVKKFFDDLHTNKIMI